MTPVRRSARRKSLTAALGQVTAEAATTAPAIDDIAAASDTAGASATSFTQAFNQVDKSLKAAGISLGPIPGALDEITRASGKTITELGLLGTAGAVAAAGLAGWNIGRWVADLTGADEWISRTTASLMGWGDVAAQEAAAGADTLARASAIAGREITNMAEAVSRPGRRGASKAGRGPETVDGRRRSLCRQREQAVRL